MSSRVLRTAAASVQDCGAFIDRTAALVGADTGLLAGLTFAVKDLYDVRSYLFASDFAIHLGVPLLIDQMPSDVANTTSGG